MPTKPKKPQRSMTQQRTVTASRIKAKYSALIAAIRLEATAAARKSKSHYLHHPDYEAIAERAKLLPPAKRRLLESAIKSVRNCLAESREIVRDLEQREENRREQVNVLLDQVSDQRELCILQVSGATLTPAELAVERQCRTFQHFYATAAELGLDAKKIKKCVPRV